jgi:group I intron endonuclease
MSSSNSNPSGSNFNWLDYRLKELSIYTTPLQIYFNFKEYHLKLIREEKNRTGIYYFINLLNGHCYIGSSKNISQRMRNHLNRSYLILKKNSNMPFTRSLLKYGSENFCVVIIEYSKLEDLYERETFWILKLKPYYNILTEGGSSNNYKHSDYTKEILSNIAKNRILSSTTKVSISESLKGKLNHFYGKKHSYNSLDKIIEKKSLNKIYIYNSFKELLVILPSVKTLAKKINSNSATITKAIRESYLFRGEWYISSSLFSEEDFNITAKYLSYHSCDDLINEMIANSSVKKALFLFDSNKKFIRKYSGIMEAEKDLGIRHEEIKKYANLKKEFNGYIFSYHRLLDY